MTIIMLKNTIGCYDVHTKAVGFNNVVLQTGHGALVTVSTSRAGTSLPSITAIVALEMGWFQIWLKLCEFMHKRVLYA